MKDHETEPLTRCICEIRIVVSKNTECAALIDLEGRKASSSNRLGLCSPTPQTSFWTPQTSFWRRLLHSALWKRSRRRNPAFLVYFMRLRYSETRSNTKKRSGRFTIASHEDEIDGRVRGVDSARESCLEYTNAKLA